MSSCSLHFTRSLAMSNRRDSVWTGESEVIARIAPRVRMVIRYIGYSNLVWVANAIPALEFSKYPSDLKCAVLVSLVFHLFILFLWLSCEIIYIPLGRWNNFHFLQQLPAEKPQPPSTTTTSAPTTTTTTRQTMRTRWVGGYLWSLIFYLCENSQENHAKMLAVDCDSMFHSLSLAYKSGNG